MNLASNLRKVAAFFWRDFAIARGYRGALLLETIEALFGVATFYYLSRFVQSPELSSELPAGANYFAFALVGFAFFDYLNVSLSAFHPGRGGVLDEFFQAHAVHEVKVDVEDDRDLRLLPHRFGFAPRSANWPGAVAILLASILAFAGLGILSAGYSILFKRGNPAKWIVLGLSGLLGGMMYPVSVLPAPLQMLARLIPVTYSLEGMRGALLAGAGWRELFPSIGALLLFAVILIPLSFAVFAWALRRTKITGTLTHI